MVPAGIYLGIDFGQRRIGLAKSDPTGTIASPLMTLSVTSARDAVRQLSKVIEEVQPAGLVIGYPISMSGEKGPACAQIDDLIPELQRSFTGTIHKVDERLTSKAASRVIHQHGRKTGQDKGRVDRIAAVLILQQFLDSR
jgi:putative Holliday junction resolvase